MRSRHLWRMAGLLAALALIPLPAGAQTLRVMTFNVRYPAPGDGPNRWQERRDLMVRTIRKAKPDVLGTQELYKRQGDYLVTRLPRYRWFGVDRRGGHGDEHMGVFYRADRLRLRASGNFWLSETPDRPGSISWGHPFPRVVTRGLFEVKATGRRFYFFNTHLPYRERDEPARIRAAQEILSRMKALQPEVPVVLTGDFNTAPDSPTHALLTRCLHDARRFAAVNDGPDATFHDFTGTPDRRIDWILYRRFDARVERTITLNHDKRYPSDHFPVLAELRWLPTHPGRRRACQWSGHAAPPAPRSGREDHGSPRPAAGEDRLRLCPPGLRGRTVSHRR